MTKQYLFTSESVTEGHPDKLADQISDVILDAILKQDPHAHVACETYIKTGLVLVGGEINTEAWVDVEQLIRNKINSIGYTNSLFGFDGNSCAILNTIGRQSPDIDQGVKEVTLLGQNVNSYGRDLTARLRAEPHNDAAGIRLTGATWAREQSSRARPLFGDLLRSIGAIEGIRRVRFTSPHPKDLRPETIAAMAETIAVLQSMRRGYTAERYLQRLRDARAAIEDLAVTTDVIVGFPGETEADFEDTLALCAEAEFDGAFTFIFSARPGTRAAEMTEHFVDDDVIADRFSRLKTVIDRASLERNRVRVGRNEEVVVEGFSRKDADVLAGRTRQNKLVHFRSDDEQLTPGRYATVQVTAAGGHHLIGELIEVEAPVEPASADVSARPRRLIPVRAI